MKVQRISAITLRVSDMARSIEFYNQLLGLEILYGGRDSFFSSLRTAGNDVILNLEQGTPQVIWGRIIFWVEDVDQAWEYLRSKGFTASHPRDAAWGERYFHLRDPDGHELSFAQPLP